MEQKKNLSVQLPVTLHGRVREEQEAKRMTLSEYMELVLNEHFTHKEEKVMGNTRTLAFQVSEELFNRLKEYLAKHNLKQKDFVVGLIEQALEQDQIQGEERVQTEEQDEEQTEEQDEEQTEEQDEEQGWGQGPAFG